MNEAARWVDLEEWIDRLLAMGFDEFKAIVDDDLRSRAPALASAALRADVMLERWRLSLVAMKQAVEGTLAARANDERLARHVRSEGHDEGDYLRWRSGAIRFRTGIEEALAEVAFQASGARGQGHS